MIDLARIGTIRAAGRSRAPRDLARTAKRALAAVPRTPASLALEQIMKGAKGPGRYPVAPAIERTLDGILFDSKAEAAHYARLKIRERLGEIRDIEIHPPFPLDVNGVRCGVYTADFAYVICATGRREVTELKSSGTRKDPAYRLRRKIAQAIHRVVITEVVA